MSSDDTNLNSISEDGFWQLEDGEWIATEKQIAALENGATPYDANQKISDAVDSKPAISDENESNRFSISAKMEPQQAMYVVSGVCLLALLVSIIVIIASISQVSNTLTGSTDCGANSSDRMMAGGDCPDKLNIASWNLEVFGPSKANDPDTLSEIAEKISQYDVVAVQELKDIQQLAPYILQDELDNHGEFGIVLSNRTGSYCESKSSSQISEQYAFYYNVDTIKALDSGHHYPNTDCEFAREPFAARFQSVEYSHKFVLITAHVRPGDAVDEIKNLTNVFEWAKFQFPNEDDFILLGDLNADCDYASTSDLDMLEIRNGDYEWIIPDGISTNTATSSSCAYDRIIFGENGSDEYLGSYSTDCQTEASDHCIVSALYSANEA